jgi:hypothetical protein
VKVEALMQEMASGILGSLADNLALMIPILIVLIALLVVYLVLLVKAIIQMLRYDVHGVLLAFAFLALVPFPLILIMGVMVLIIWHYHKRDIESGLRAQR